MKDDQQKAITSAHTGQHPQKETANAERDIASIQKEIRELKERIKMLQESLRVKEKDSDLPGR